MMKIGHYFELMMSYLMLKVEVTLTPELMLQLMDLTVGLGEKTSPSRALMKSGILSTMTMPFINPH